MFYTNLYQLSIDSVDDMYNFYCLYPLYLDILDIIHKYKSIHTGRFTFILIAIHKYRKGTSVCTHLT